MDRGRFSREWEKGEEEEEREALIKMAKYGDGYARVASVARQKLQYQVNLATSRRPGLWGPQPQLLGAAFGAGVCSCSGPRHLQGARSSWT
ncbi:hypothetical protein V6N13_092729 [Hibiscus sabdariffa]